MKDSHVIGFILICSLPLSVLSQLQCTMVDPCSCQPNNAVAGNLINLHSIASVDGEAKFIVEASGTTFFFNPCIGFSLGTLTDLAVAKRTAALMVVDMGIQSNVSFDYSTNYPRLLYTSADNVHTSFVVLKCNETIGAEVSLTSTWPTTFDLVSACACPGFCDDNRLKLFCGAGRNLFDHGVIEVWEDCDAVSGILTSNDPNEVPSITISAGQFSRFDSNCAIHEGNDSSGAVLAGVSEGGMFNIRASGQSMFYECTFSNNASLTLLFQSESEHALTCGEQTLLRLETADLTELNAQMGDTLYIATTRDTNATSVNPACRKVVGTDDLEFSFAINECEGIKMESGDTLEITYIVWNDKFLVVSQAIQRYSIHCKNYTCVYNTTEMVDSLAVAPKLRKIGFTADPVIGELTVNFDLSLTDNFTDPLTSGSTVFVPDFVYGQISLPDMPTDATNFVIQMTSCWATQSSDPASGPIYPIIESSCEATSLSEPNGTVNVIRNYLPLYGVFNFKSFEWTNVTSDEQAIYVHCMVTICDSSLQGADCSSPACRKRRSLGDAVNHGERHSFGPIYVSTFPEEETFTEIHVMEITKENDEKISVASIACIGLFMVAFATLLRFIGK